MLELKDFAQIAGGIVAYSLITQTFNFVLKFRANGKGTNGVFIVESLKEIKTKLDAINEKLGGKKNG